MPRHGEIPFVVASDKTVDALKAAWERPLLARIAELEAGRDQLLWALRLSRSAAAHLGWADTVNEIDAALRKAGAL